MRSGRGKERWKNSIENNKKERRKKEVKNEESRSNVKREIFKKGKNEGEKRKRRT
jgi:hypothetical protein